MTGGHLEIGGCDTVDLVKQFGTPLYVIHPLPFGGSGGLVMDFVKMHGLGNDFVIVEEINLPPIELPKLARGVCDRHRGIGADGLVILGKSTLAPWRMQIFNSDGTEAEMCGNALRCVGKYLYEGKLVSTRDFDLETHGNTLRALRLKVHGREVQEVEVDMGEPILRGADIPVDMDLEKIVDSTIQVGDRDLSLQVSPWVIPTG